ncbi:MAG TPA: hypothetical protein VFO42_01115 [Sphingomicrobium sp.]|nr:hypothetical protein [Sphingomicrobium sp.]
MRDTVRLEDGQSIKSSRTADLDGDGVADLYVELTGGGSISLIGIDSIGDVRVETAGSPASVMGWREAAPAIELAMLQPHFADPSAQALDQAMLIAASNHAL